MLVPAAGGHHGHRERRGGAGILPLSSLAAGHLTHNLQTEQYTSRVKN